ncbi:hypothetical protein QYF36_023879 [Acer negundo]|nr:hypothetical protein QYF36_023879 [Acer negundo]
MEKRNVAMLGVQFFEEVVPVNQDLIIEDIFEGNMGDRRGSDSSQEKNGLPTGGTECGNNGGSRVDDMGVEVIKKKGSDSTNKLDCLTRNLSRAGDNMDWKRYRTVERELDDVLKLESTRIFFLFLNQFESSPNKLNWSREPESRSNERKKQWRNLSKVGLVFVEFLSLDSAPEGTYLTIEGCRQP